MLILLINVYNYLSSNCTAPSSAPLNLTATVVSSTSVVFAWEPPIPEDTNGLIISYILYITSIQSDEMAFQLTASSTTTAHSAFQPYSTYAVTVAAETAAGEGPLSPTEMFTMWEDGILIRTT